MDHLLSLSISIPFGDHPDDSDRSEVTGPNLNCCDVADPLEIYGVQPSSRRSRRVLGNIAPFDEGQQQELVKLKLQIAKQREAIDILESKLSHCRALNETLKAENAGLIDEVALARVAIEERSISSSASRRFSLRGQFVKGNDGNGGSMQMLVNSNATLLFDNARLQVSVDGLRKSFQSYVRFSQRISRADKETIDSMKNEIESLKQRKELTEFDRAKTLSEGDSTSKTSLVSEDVTHEDQDDMPAPVDSSEHPIMNQDGIRVNSNHPAAKHENKLKASSDEWGAKGEVEGAAKAPGEREPEINSGEAARRRSTELLVDFGEARRARARGRKRHSMAF